MNQDEKRQLEKERTEAYDQVTKIIQIIFWISLPFMLVLALLPEGYWK